jgi:hypothetical protein
MAASSWPGNDLAEVFQPAIDALKPHLREAMVDPASKSAFTLVAAIAFPGVQADDETQQFLYTVADSSAPQPQRLVALLGLARLKPLPARAIQVLLSKTSGLTAGAKLYMLVHALSDREIHSEFAKSLASESVTEQKTAAGVLATTADCGSALDDLLAVKSQTDLD